MTFEQFIRDALAALRAASYENAAALLRRADEIADSDAQRELAAIHRASIDVLRGRRDVDLNVFRENLVRRHSPKHVQLAAYYLVISAVDRNDRESAVRYLPILLDAAAQLGDPAVSLSAYDVAAGVESIRGNHVAAIEYGRVALDEAKSYQGEDVDLTMAGLAHNLAYNCLAANRFGEALQYAQMALPYAQRCGNRDGLLQCLVTAAFAYLCCDELDDVERLTQRAEDLAAGSRLARYIPYLRGEVARRRGDTDAAAQHFRKLEEFYPEVPGVAEILLSINVAPFLLPE